MRKINESIIFVDCFDTILHRQEHPYQVLRRWAKCIQRLYPKIEAEKLYRDRFQLIRDSKEGIDRIGIYHIYSLLADQYESRGCLMENQKSQFIEDLREVELECESSVHYLNKKLNKILKEQKDKKIYCLTDYHFSSEDMGQILKHCGISFPIERIFSSADWKATKHDGMLYDAVLKFLFIQPEQCVMIGDNKHSDMIKARERGIRTIYMPHKLHQFRLKLENRFGRGSGRQYAIKNLTKKYWKESDNYEEYILLFYTFCVRLYKAVRERGGRKVVFLAREGWYLKKCFDAYQKYCIPFAERLKTDYLKCSRRAIHSVQREKCNPDFFGDISLKNYFKSIGFSSREVQRLSIPFDMDKVIEHFSESEEAEFIRKTKEIQDLIEKRFQENQRAFLQYVQEKRDGEFLYLVDVGWLGRMQQGIDCLFPNVTTVGYYIGIYDNLLEPPEVERNGLIFHKTTKGLKSECFEIFRSNIQIYEQLLAAPHGSACSYRLLPDGTTDVLEEWDEKECSLYHDAILAVQNRMDRMFQNVCRLNFEDVTTNAHTRRLAKMVLKSCLIQSRARLNFMKQLNAGFSQNFQQQTSGIIFDTKQVDVKPVELLRYPQKYVRYFAKAGVILDQKNMGFLRYPIMGCFYFYTRLCSRI